MGVNPNRGTSRMSAWPKQAPGMVFSSEYAFGSAL